MVELSSDKPQEHSDSTEVDCDGEVGVPICPSELSFEQACCLIEEMLQLLAKFEDMSNLKTIYRAAKQLNRTYFSCSEHRIHIAHFLVDQNFPSMLTKFIKRLNNMGTFKDDEIWFSSFYFYSIAWNYSEISDEFATALAASRIARLLNLNIGHQPYLENIGSKNVYFLIKASLSIIFNMCKVPGNGELSVNSIGREALLKLLAFQEEETLRCLATLCLAYTLYDPYIDEALAVECGSTNMFNVLVSQIQHANASTRKRNHGFPLSEYLMALATFCANETVKVRMLSAKILNLRNKSKELPKLSEGLLMFLSKMLDTKNISAYYQEAIIVLRIIYHLLHLPQAKTDPGVRHCVKCILVLSQCAAIKENPDPLLARVIEQILWKDEQSSKGVPYTNHPIPERGKCGPVVVSYSPENQLAAAYFMEQLQSGGLPVLNQVNKDLANNDNLAYLAGLTGLGVSFGYTKDWLLCLQKASVMIVCISEAYRLNPGCRTEIEYFIESNEESNPKYLIYILLPPRFTLNGWLVDLPGVDQYIDFTHRRTFITALKQLHRNTGEIFGLDTEEPVFHETDNTQASTKERYVSELRSSTLFFTSSSSVSEPTESISLCQKNDSMRSKGGSRHCVQDRAKQTGKNSSEELISEKQEITVDQDPSIPLQFDLKFGEDNDFECAPKSVERSRLPTLQSPQFILENNTDKIDGDLTKQGTRETETSPHYKADFSLENLKTTEDEQRINYQLRNDNLMRRDQGVSLHNSARPDNTANHETMKLNEGKTENVQLSNSDEKSKPTCNLNHVVSSVPKGSREPLLASTHPTAECAESGLLAQSIGKVSFETSSKRDILQSSQASGQISQTSCKKTQGVSVSVVPRENLVSVKYEYAKMNLTSDKNGKKEMEQSSCQQNKLEYHVEPKTDSNSPMLNAAMETVGNSTSELVTQITDMLIRSTTPIVTEDEHMLKDVSQSHESKPEVIEYHDFRPLDRKEPMMRTLQTFPSGTVSINSPPSEKCYWGRSLGKSSSQIPFEASPTLVMDVKPDPDLNKIHLREWTNVQVTQWLDQKGLKKALSKFIGEIDGVVLEQMSQLRHWAPEYFAQSLQSQLNLNFIDGLRFLDALSELTRRE
ncbi:unnamed protein product [Echinostoma caproni]|uniref:TIR domain-containing protein n=1 Tax=Echinostoma caproni TaxID=27848 RepID=A0A183AZR5_9TREM|nr:unnamed protein product [Echinostoma caproni]